ncbi:MAG: PASTA domain-containing protein, partial [Chloroflexota bacterium]
ASQRDDATGVLSPVTRPLPGRKREFHVDTTIALLAIVAVLVATLAIFASFQGRAVDAPRASGPAASAAARVTPNVVGKDVDEAGRLLIAAGYRSPVPWQVDPQAQGQPCTVARQEPPAGSAVQPGATARLFLVGPPSGKQGGTCGGKSKD